MRDEGQSVGQNGNTCTGRSALGTRAQGGHGIGKDVNAVLREEGGEMKLQEYVNNLKKLIKERPETALFDVVTSKDDEGNGFSLVHYAPSVGHFDENGQEFEEEKELNAVCVN
jgi:hypothetical protein